MTAKTSIARLLRCPWNFEVDYAGQHGSTPILFTHPFTENALPAGVPDPFTALDAEAYLQVPPKGVSPVLAKFFPVPIGATAALYFPIVRSIGPTGVFSADSMGWGYVWRAVFRLRSVLDFTRRKTNRIPFTIGDSARGQSDSRTTSVLGRPNAVLAGERTVRPAIMTGLIFNPSPPDPNSSLPIFGYLYPDAVAIPSGSDLTQCPIYPGAGVANANIYIRNLDYEQGETDPQVVSVGFGPEGITKRSPASHVSKFVKIMGNEMAVECFKYNFENGGIPLSARDWDFEFDGNGNVSGGEDFGFSLTLGSASRLFGHEPSSDTGVRVVVGQWPR